MIATLEGVGNGMMKLIFPMYNSIHSADSRWRQSTFTDGSQHTIRSYKNTGFCSGMVVVWIKKSIASSGRGVRESDMPSRHFMGIVQSAYAKKTLFDSKNQDYGFGLIYLLQSQNLITQACVAGNGFFSVEGIVDWVLSEPGHYILLFFNERGIDSLYNGHTIGFRYERDVMQMFEPERGLFEYTDRESFTSHLSSLTQKDLYRSIYPKMGGNWYLHRVASET